MNMTIMIMTKNRRSDTIGTAEIFLYEVAYITLH